ncbi:hypothetical protein AAFF_G00122040 [Aldrovandia affinis]|uniref:Macro domain-containing protein n=1 Tax=Aldrovandia affinis TaxID=143900 RepID=A0AAD7VX44_9TELE|nr:hypothetical protein AAFF_G00122040 [Aldrovandia affinis]
MCLRYITGDLFSSPETDALAHCISADCHMAAGIAVDFKNRYGGVRELQMARLSPGGVGVLERGPRTIFYLVTKSIATNKPTYATLCASLKAMKVECISRNITKVSIPRIGCRLDRLRWGRVAVLIKRVFLHSGI